VPRNLVQQHAERFEMPESYANHVLNRALPATRLMKQKMAGIDMKSSTTQRRRAHGSGSWSRSINLEEARSWQLLSKQYSTEYERFRS